METITVLDRDHKPTIAVVPVAFSIDRTFALHLDADDGARTWTITHVKTGRSVFVGIRRRKDAERAMETLVARHGGMFRRIREYAAMPSPSIIRARDAIKPLAQTLPLNYVPHYWRD